MDHPTHPPVSGSGSGLVHSLGRRVLGILPLLLVGMLLIPTLSPRPAVADGPGEKGTVGKHWTTWRDDVRHILRIDYRELDGSSFEFDVYRNKDWNGQGDEYDHLENFTITQREPNHGNHWPEFYGSVAGKIDVTYEVNADYKARKVRCKGSVKYPNPEFPFSMEEKKWDQDFFTIPTPDNVIETRKNGYDYVEVSEVWTGFCSDFPCGNWVRIPGKYTEAHRYDVEIPGIGKVIVQLWKGECPRFSDNFDTERLKKWNFGGKYPGGIGAEVGVYRPMDKGSMQDAARSQQWVPVVDPKLRISFRLIDPKSGTVFLEAEEKQTWWRTKWMTIESYETYKKSARTPDSLLKYELHYSINGIEQPPWKYSGDPGVYDLGFDGIWTLMDDSNHAIWNAATLAGAPREIELHRDGQTVRIAWESMKTTVVATLGGSPAPGSDVWGAFRVSAKEAGGNLTLDFVYDDPKHNRTNVLQVDENQVLTLNGFGALPFTFLPQ